MVSFLNYLRHTAPYAYLRDRRYLWRHRSRRRFYAPFVSRGSLVFDIGANVGHYTLLFNNLGARIVAIEPQQALCAGLRLRFARCHRITIEHCAVGSTPGQADLHKTAGLTEVASLRDDVGRSSRFAAEHAFDLVESVPVLTFTTLIARHGIPDFCKIDVEGFEHEVISGLRIPIPALSFEFNREYLDTAQACLTTLSALGPYRFNYTLAERDTFEAPSWMDGPSIVKALLASPDPLLWGDIHARLSPP